MKIIKLWGLIPLIFGASFILIGADLFLSEFNIEKLIISILAEISLMGLAYFYSKTGEIKYFAGLTFSFVASIALLIQSESRRYISNDSLLKTELLQSINQQISDKRDRVKKLEKASILTNSEVHAHKLDSLQRMKRDLLMNTEFSDKKLSFNLYLKIFIMIVFQFSNVLCINYFTKRDKVDNNNKQGETVHVQSGDKELNKLVSLKASHSWSELSDILKISISVLRRAYNNKNIHDENLRIKLREYNK